MSYGVRVWGPTGALELDENSFTVRIVYSALVQKTAAIQARSIFIPIAGVTPATHSAVCVPVAAYPTDAQDIRGIQYTPIVGNGGVTLFFGQPSTNSGPVGIAVQRLLVMRFR
ncbi:hypothetical protein CXQ82_16290 [Pseudomonas sp. S09G 359]|nr:hypothetical protein CXQ82_16290 [Pseudomonas sp. S09G 359]